MIISVNSSLLDIYQRSGHDVNYTLQELSGYLGKKAFSLIPSFNMLGERKEIDVDDFVVNHIRFVFPNSEIGSIVDLLLYNNYILGYQI